MFIETDKNIKALRNSNLCVISIINMFSPTYSFMKKTAFLRFELNPFVLKSEEYRQE